MSNPTPLCRCRPLACALLAMLMTAAGPSGRISTPAALSAPGRASVVFVSVVWVPAPCDVLPGEGGDAVFSLYPEREGAEPLTPCALLGGPARRLHA